MKGIRKGEPRSPAMIFVGGTTIGGGNVVAPSYRATPHMRQVASWDGGTGRHDRLRAYCRKAWGFKSPSQHFFLRNLTTRTTLVTVSVMRIAFRAGNPKDVVSLGVFVIVRGGSSE